jgi:hypothetical protein
MRFNTETRDNPPTSPAHALRRAADDHDRKNVEAAQAASAFTQSKGFERCAIVKKCRSIALDRDMRMRIVSESTNLEQTNLEILGFKNQMTHFIFHLRPVYLSRTIKGARCTSHSSLEF